MVQFQVIKFLRNNTTQNRSALFCNLRAVIFIMDDVLPDPTRCDVYVEFSHGLVKKADSTPALMLLTLTVILRTQAST
ncbi:hypothetical protein RRG08_043048 [Elysia crispata]|uniref:Uncharacterized protein n=1 Tax=Elysia crispata TaxID=231223 RepID=A0AAE1CPR8_9GAST|nr:hypothetical protein RRG08_043048 [Elysia crispata]